MKYFTILTLALSFNAFADPTTNLEDQKTLANNAIDAAISRLQDEKPCVQKAQSEADLKACRVKLKEQMTTMRDSIKETREDVRAHHKKTDGKKM